MEEGRLSIKSVVRLFCAAVFMSSSPLRFLPNCQRVNELLLSVPAKEAQILGLCSAVSAGGLVDDRAEVRIYTGVLHVSIREHCPVGGSL